VRQPIRAAANAASHPACPDPTTSTSKSVIGGNCTRLGWRGENSPPTPLTVPTLLGLMGLDGENAVPESYTQEDG